MSYVGMSPEVSKSEGRVAQTTNVVIGGTVTDDATDEWLVLDQKVLQNVYSQTMAWLLFTCVNAFVCLCASCMCMRLGCPERESLCPIYNQEQSCLMCFMYGSRKEI